MAVEKFNGLPLISSDTAAKRAKEHLDDHEFKGVICRWPKINEILNGGFRYERVFMLAGMSGSGKSYFLNVLLEDFTDIKLNPKSPKILHFSFEMMSYIEALRHVGRQAQVSYSEMVSPDNALNDTLKDQLKVLLDKYGELPIYIVETAGNLDQMWDTMEEFKKSFPDDDVIVSVDHTLLARHKRERDDIELLANMGKMCMSGKKEFGYMYILLNQLNDKIEDPNRLSDKRFHFPTKRDIHGSKQVYWACDGVCVIHRPEMLNISKYGTAPNPDRTLGWYTDGLLACHWLKIREGVPGIIRMRERLNFGTLEQW